MRTVPLGDLCEIRVGRTPARANPSFWGRGQPWLSIADMNQGLLISQTKEQITPEGEWRGGLVSVGTVLLSFKLSIGKVAIAGMPLYTNEAIAALPLRDASRLDSRYLLRALQAMDIARSSNRAAMGATLNKAALLNIPIPLPPIEEQRRIAAILDQADVLRVKRRQVLSKLDDLVESRFDARFERANQAASWPIRELAELGHTRLGKMLDKKKQSGRDGRRYLRNANVQWFHIDTSDLLTMDFDFAERNTFELRDGDVLVCEGGQPGRSAIWHGQLDDCYFQKALHRVRLGPDILPEYFVRYMKRMTERGTINDFVTSATIAHLTGEKLRKLPIVVPPISKQEAWSQDLSVINAQIKKGNDLALAADGLFASLQARAFRGEL